jgi:hypothetical protein
MNGKKLLSLWGLKWNPFSPELPSELLAYAVAHEVSQLDEKFYLELFHSQGRTSKKKARA